MAANEIDDGEFVLSPAVRRATSRLRALGYDPAEARRRLPEFVGALTAPTPTMNRFSLLVRRYEKDQWLTGVRWDGDAFLGSLPPSTSACQSRDAMVRATPDHVLDWCYVHQQRLMGGFTFRERMKRVILDIEKRHSKGIHDSACGPASACSFDNPNGSRLNAKQGAIHSLEDLDYLVDRAVDRHATPIVDCDRTTPLYRLLDAIGDGDLRSVDQLASVPGVLRERGWVAFPNTLGHVKGWRVSPLFYAIERRNEEAAITCLRRGSDPLEVCDWLTTPWHRAILWGQLAVAKEMVLQGFDVDIPNDGGYTALTIAVNNAHVELMRWLIAAGADVNYRTTVPDPYEGTRVISPVLSPSLVLSAAMILHEAGAKFDVADGEGQTALHTAAANREYDLVKFLLDGKCDRSAKDREGQTALEYGIAFPGSTRTNKRRLRELLGPCPVSGSKGSL